MSSTVILAALSHHPLALSSQELEDLLQMVLDHQGVTRAVELSVVAVDQPNMAQLNATYRGVDEPTDVLAIELERPDDPSLAKGELCCLGDLVLCPSYISAQARVYEVSQKDETRLLAIHGLLHLLGFDHETPVEAALMEQAQNLLVARATKGRITRVTLGPHEGGIS